MVLGEGVRLSAIGLAAGLAGAYLVGRGMQSMLYGVRRSISRRSQRWRRY